MCTDLLMNSDHKLKTGSVWPTLQVTVAMKFRRCVSRLSLHLLHPSVHAFVHASLLAQHLIYRLGELHKIYSSYGDKDKL